jgi:hypothetical protein
MGGWRAFELMPTAPDEVSAVSAGRSAWALPAPAGLVLADDAALPDRLLIDERDRDPAGFSGTLRRLAVADRLGAGARVADQYWRTVRTTAPEGLEPIYARPPTITPPRSRAVPGQASAGE